MEKNDKNTVLNIATSLNQTFMARYNYDWFKNYLNQQQDYSIEFLCNMSDKIESYLKLMGILNIYVASEEKENLVNILVDLQKDEIEACVRSIGELMPILANLTQEEKIDLVVEIAILQNDCNVKMVVSEIQKMLKHLLKTHIEGRK